MANFWLKLLCICIFVVINFSSTNSRNGSYYDDDYDIGNLTDESSKNLSVLSTFLNAQKRKRASGAVNLVKKDFISILESAQLKLKENDLECMPGSVFYNGTCIFISSKRQKLSWIHSERFCRKLPLNTSFLRLENNHKYEFIRNEMIKLREKENPIDQLVFYVGFRYQNNEWKWTSNQSLVRTNLTLGKYWWDWSGSHGDCGSIALLKNNEMIMRSAPCLSTSNRFMCEYNLNPCYKNDVCGPRGRCVNLLYDFYCDCTVSLFYEGKYCENLNSAGIQAIIGLIVVCLLALGIFCNTSIFIKTWNKYFGKDKKKAQDLSQAEKGQVARPGSVAFSDTKTIREKSKDFRSLSRQIRKSISRIVRKFYDNNVPYIVLIVLTLLLAFIQIIFTHSFISFEIIDETKKSAFVKGMCKSLAEYYMFEDLIYLPFSLGFLLFLYLFLQSRRFNKYIMVKYKNYFKSNIFKEIQERYVEEHRKKKKAKEQDLKQQSCGMCRYFSYKCCTQKFCSVFCCLFCCSCCVPPGSNTRCFVWYCCCLGWRQTDFYKILNTIWSVIKAIFYYGLGCPIWVRLWKLTKKNREEKAKKKKMRQKSVDGDINSNQDNDSTDIDQDDEFDVDDYNVKTQTFSRGQCPFPSTPFSTTNRAQSAAVYMIYTYDVLNIFIFVFTGSFLSTNLPIFGQIGRTSGILIELVIQFLQVIMIGIKFYPILVVADAEPHLLIYLVSTIYMLFIWCSWFFKKALCSRTEAFIKQAFLQAKDQISDRIKSSFRTKLNVSNTFFGLFTDLDAPSETYMYALRDKIPKTFKDYFGKYNPNDQSEFSNDDLLLYNSLNGNNGDLDSNFLNNYYMLNAEQSRAYMTTTVPITLASTTRTSFRSMLKNKTIDQLKPLSIFYYHRDEGFYNFLNILENLPIYLTLSYLLVRYSMLFISSFVDFIRNKWRFKANYDYGRDLNKKKTSDPQRILTIYEIKENIAICDRMLEDLNKGYKEKNKLTNQTQNSMLDDDGEAPTVKNHNYCYIKNLLRDVNLYGRSSVKEESSFRNTLKVSLVVHFIEKYIYKPVPYMKFSKQFLNTFTVAFMVIYFFTLFGLRLTNIFGDGLVGTIEIVYKFIFRGLIPTLDLNEHNFNAEFRTTCLITSILIFFQLLSSVKTFHEDLIRLNKGEKFFTSLVLKYKDDEYSKIIKKRNKESVTIASDSLHFPGYLVAHLIYGYVLLFISVFCVMVIFKIFYYLPGATQASLNLLLPLFILFAFKFIFLKYLVRTIFLRTDQQRITNLAPYYVIGYFNFFFDCFLGLLACASRIWQTTIISMIRLPRLDKSMFNREDDLLMRRLDKGHLAYLNYVRMEHWYNNAILNGFCEMLLESMFYSQIYKEKYRLMTWSVDKFVRHNSEMTQRNLSVNDGFLEFQGANLIGQLPNFGVTRSMSVDPNKLSRRVNFDLEGNLGAIDVPSSSEYYKSIKKKAKSKKTNSEIIDDDEEENNYRPNSDRIEEEEEEHHYEHDYEEEDLPREEPEQLLDRVRNGNFEYKSFLRLRNIIYLCLLLRKNPSLRKYRYHYLQELRKKEQARKQNRVQSTAELFNEKFEKLKQKLNIKNFGLFQRDNSSGTSSTNTHQDFEDDIDNNVDESNVVSSSNDPSNSEIKPFVRKHVRTSSL